MRGTLSVIKNDKIFSSKAPHSDKNGEDEQTVSLIKHISFCNFSFFVIPPFMHTGNCYRSIVATVLFISLFLQLRLSLLNKFAEINLLSSIHFTSMTYEINLVIELILYRG